jgi:hypothetical protein
MDPRKELPTVEPKQSSARRERPLWHRPAMIRMPMAMTLHGADSTDDGLGPDTSYT